MKKIFIVILLIFSFLFLCILEILPCVDYSKINFISYQSQSIGMTETELKDPNVIIVQAHLKYDNFHYENSYNINMTKFESKQYEKEFRDDAKDFHNGNNNSILKQLDLKTYQELYVSSYSPFIDITYNYEYFMRNKNQILKNISMNNYIDEISIRESSYDYLSCIDYSASASGAGTVYNNRTKTGDGVVVGILETGVIDTNHEDLAGVDITIRSHASNLVVSKTHTTHMALLIAGEHGVAPGVTLLNASLYGSMTEEIDWMLQNGVDIINMSFMDNANQGTYSSTSAYVDYIAYTYNVIIVAAAGNNGEGTGYIGNPGLGYNVITVGSMSLDGRVDDCSSYTSINGPIKPTICTVGGAVRLYDADNTYVSGTSVAAALCSGFLALILEDRPSLAMDKGRLVSLMSVCASYTEYQTWDEDNGFDSLVGAGLFNYQKMIDNYWNAKNYSNSSGVAGTTIYTDEVYLTAGQTLRASVALDANSTGTVSSLQFTDYDIFIGNANDSQLAWGNSDNSTVDMAMYTAPTSGYYTIRVYQVNAKTNNVDYLGVSYSII